MTSATKIFCFIAPLATMMMLSEASNALDIGTRLQDRDRALAVNEISDLLLTDAGSLTRERAMVDRLLANGAIANSDLSRQIAISSTAADQSLAAAHDRIQAMGMEADVRVRYRLAAATLAADAVAELRQRLSVSINPATDTAAVEEWHPAITRSIAAVQDLRAAVEGRVRQTIETQIAEVRAIQSASLLESPQGAPDPGGRAMIVAPDGPTP